jgi:hypothetical protein
MFAEMGGVFIGGEARTVGSDLKENTAWFSKIKGLEIKAVNEG